MNLGVTEKRFRCVCRRCRTELSQPIIWAVRSDFVTCSQECADDALRSIVTRDASAVVQKRHSAARGTPYYYVMPARKRPFGIFWPQQPSVLR